ncbi:MAG TPA: type II secretion system F family protein, partial [Candidatus Wujingus californicus]
MSTFKYKLLSTSSGIIEGEKEAPTKIELITELRKTGHVILSVQQTTKDKKFGFLSGRANKKAILPFTQELATLLEGGIPIDKSLAILLSSHDIKIRPIVENLLNGIKSGKSLAEALNSHVKLFSSVYINMVRAGEEGGVLPQVLKRLGMFQEKLQKIRGEIISAMIYPL